MIPVKTDKPIKKSEIFEVMKKINTVTCEKKVKIGDVVYKNITEDINLIVSGNIWQNIVNMLLYIEKIVERLWKIILEKMQNR